MTERRTLFTIEQVAVHCGVDTTYVERLVRVGVIDPAAGERSRFQPEVTVRVRKARRLEQDLGVNPEGAAVILDLLDYIERLERSLRR